MGAREPLTETLAESAAALVQQLKPRLRGWLHLVAFPLTVIAGIVLVALAPAGRGRIACAIFAATAAILFGTSALYHRGHWSPSRERLLKRIDHSNIFLIIAGSYTPFAVLLLPHEQAKVLLAIVWSGALLGVAFRVFWVGAPRWLYVPIYVLLGWAAMMFIVDFFQASWIMMTLIIVGGLCYTAGAVIYGLKRPNPFPGKFGFHEIFHTLTLLAFLCHWTGIFIVAINPPVLA